MNSTAPFALPLTFMDPVSKNNEHPWQVTRFNKIIEERWFISSKTNTSYLDTGKITPTERLKLIELIKKEQDGIAEILNKK